MMAKDYYDILGVPKNASQEQIKKAYREQVLKSHPDINKDPKAEARMRELNEAYAVLSNEEKRRQYDAYGPEGFGQTFSRDDIFRDFDFEQIFKDMGINFGFGGVPGGEFFGGGEQQTGVNVYFSFKDLEKGVDREFEVQRYKVCDGCKGSGGEPGSKQIRCAACNGTGQRRIQSRSFLGSFQMITTCDRCRGRGRTYEKTCRACNGRGNILVTERFRVKAEQSGAKGKEGKGWFG